jgi:protein-tyrosine phosphatase
VPTLHVPVGDVSASPTRIAERLAAGDTDGLGAARLVAGNVAFVRELRAGFAEVLGYVMATDQHPVIVHCTAGKDRAGFAAALVLWTLGAGDEVVMADYLRSNELLAERHERILRDAGPRFSDPTPLREMLEVRREYLGAARDAIDADYGSVDVFVRDGLGVSDAERDRFRDAVLES